MMSLKSLDAFVSIHIAHSAFERSALAYFVALPIIAQTLSHQAADAIQGCRKRGSFIPR